MASNRKRVFPRRQLHLPAPILAKSFIKLLTLPSAIAIDVEDGEDRRIVNAPVIRFEQVVLELVIRKAVHVRVAVRLVKDSRLPALEGRGIFIKRGEWWGFHFSLPTAR